MTASVLKQDANTRGGVGVGVGVKRMLFTTTKHNMRIFVIGPFFKLQKNFWGRPPFQCFSVCIRMQKKKKKKPTKNTQTNHNMCT